MPRPKSRLTESAVPAPLLAVTEDVTFAREDAPNDRLVEGIAEGDVHVAERGGRRSGVAEAAAERERIRLGVVRRYRRFGREEGGAN